MRSPPAISSRGSAPCAPTRGHGMGGPLWSWLCAPLPQGWVGTPPGACRVPPRLVAAPLCSAAAARSHSEQAGGGVLRCGDGWPGAPAGQGDKLSR